MWRKWIVVNPLYLFVPIFLWIAPADAQKIQPKYSSQRISAEKRAIYRSVLRDLHKKPQENIEVSKVTSTFNAGDDDLQTCMQTFTSVNARTNTVHTLRAEDFPDEFIHLIDPPQEIPYPKGYFDSGFGLDNPPAAMPPPPKSYVVLSEIVFDRSHKHAAFTYFGCIYRCGFTGTHVYELHKGKWMQGKSNCPLGLG